MKPGRWWPIAVVAVLAITVLANVVVLWVASDPDAEAVEPDYYRKAVAWDSTRVERARNLALGWRLDATVGPLGGGGAEVRARLADAAGAPLAGATVELEAIHNRIAAHPVHAVLFPAGGAGGEAGVYAAAVPLARPGLWELRFTVRRGSDRFTVDRRLDVALAPPAGEAGP
jgi:nitrogen fixation protein FixH